MKRCECESAPCGHGEKPCRRMANPKERTIHGTLLCILCADAMPIFYMRSISDRRAAPELKLKTRRDADRLWSRRLEIAKATERLYFEGRTFEEALTEAIAATPQEATWRSTSA